MLFRNIYKLRHLPDVLNVELPCFLFPSFELKFVDFVVSPRFVDPVSDKISMRDLLDIGISLFRMLILIRVYDFDLNFDDV